MEEITLASFLTVAGGTAGVSLVILMLKAVFKELWSEWFNRGAAFVLSMLLVELAVYAAGGGAELYLAGFFVGAQVCLAVINGTDYVQAGIVTGVRRLQARKLEKHLKENG